MRYVAPARDALEARVWATPPLSHWSAFAPLLQGDAWPGVDELNAWLPEGAARRFVLQDRDLLNDGAHYEERIACRGLIATRPANWHDLFNALIWMRYDALKRALNARQMTEIQRMGPRERSRPQCALTHFDEAGIVVRLADTAMLDAWNRHDWLGLFWTHRQAWSSGEARVEVFGHALLEHALTPDKLLVGKALVVLGGDDAVGVCAEAIASGAILNDPQELRPLPVSGVPGWHPRSTDASFYTLAPCFQPLREGRVYPPALRGG
ncbi:DUF3025 domain-containing protein [Luteibacter sp. PPL201]|uniref:DUF3025 domain-containing protein n=1 Tax=Luteibacter sahnii TaxID=3021977 RepID=A0ABT6B8P6_9GAMM